MSKDGWVLKILMALIAVLVVTQLALAMEVLEAVSIIKQISGIDEKTAILNNEAAANRLESEKQRRVYYETLVNAGLFDRSFIDEDEARDIVRQGAK